VEQDTLVQQTPPREHDPNHFWLNCATNTLAEERYDFEAVRKLKYPPRCDRSFNAFANEYTPETVVFRHRCDGSKITPILGTPLSRRTVGLTGVLSRPPPRPRAVGSLATPRRWGLASRADRRGNG
jgi:hypothetical protein